MKEYVDLVKNVLMRGTRKENRTGVDTLSTFGEYYEIDLAHGFPLLTTKKIDWWHIVAENLWFISGDVNTGFLRRHKIRFWEPWADEKGDVPSAYGNFWRHFPVHGESYGTQYHDENYDKDFNDQLSWVIDEIKRNPMSRRLVVSAWYPANAQVSKLPPCHVMYIFNVQDVESSDNEKVELIVRDCHDLLPARPAGMNIDDLAWRWSAAYRLLMSTRGKAGQHSDERIRSIYGMTKRTLNLHLTQRSADVALGVPYNIAGYSFMLSLVSHLTGLCPGIFAHTLVDAHVYTDKPDGSMPEYDHVPGLRDQIKRSCRQLPRLSISPSITSLDDVSRVMEASKNDILSSFRLDGYDPHPAIRFKVAV